MKVDFLAEDFIQDPYPVLEELRAKGSIVWNELNNEWLVTNDRQCRKILADFNRFGARGTPEAATFGDQAFITMDDRPRHDYLRGVWSHAFQPTALEKMRPFIEELSDRLISSLDERLRAGEAVDVVRAFCRELPAYVISAMMGIDEEMRPAIIKCSDDMAEAAFLAGDDFSAPAWVTAEESKQLLADILYGEIARRRKDPGDDLISQFVCSDVGKSVDDLDIMINARQLLFAGNETTAKWLANAVAILAMHPEILREVVDNPDLVPGAMEEILRWEAVTQLDPRLAREKSTMMDGVEIKEGERLCLLFGAANRDPARWDDPARLDIHRNAKGHLGFGFGLHNCLGIGLARLEADIVMRRFLRTISDYSLAEELHYSLFGLRAPDAVSIRLN